MILANDEIVITGWGTISSLGSSFEEVQTSYKTWSTHCSSECLPLGQEVPVFRLAASGEKELSCLQAVPAYRKLDRVTLMSLAAGRRAVAMTQLDGRNCKNRVAVSIGSARGATNSFETHYERFLETGGKGMSTAVSPVTTAGNISSWVGYDLGMDGVDLSVSMTCTSALHAVLNGCAWLKSGMVDVFLAGGMEAPLTPFTISQMKILGFYANEPYPQEVVQDQRNPPEGLILGEGGGCFLLETRKNAEQEGRKILASIAGIGFHQEMSRSGTSISPQGEGIAASLKMALGDTIDPRDVSGIIMHAPGSPKGNAAERAAVERVFHGCMPQLFYNKSLVGHSLGGAGALNLELALLLLQGHLDFFPDNLRYVIVNAVGFGGGAISIVLRREDG